MDERDKLHLGVAAAILVLILGAYWLMSAIHRNGRLEECLMARHRNCEQFR